MTVPSIVAEVATQVVTVLADPSHKMYGKVNKFLNKAPIWDAQKTISFWIDRILLREPEDDDGHDAEVKWLLEVLVNGLRNAEVRRLPHMSLCQPGEVAGSLPNHDYLPLQQLGQDADAFDRTWSYTAKRISLSAYCPSTAPHRDLQRYGAKFCRSCTEQCR